MEEKKIKNYEFFIAGKTRNKDKILEICKIFDELNISYYCFIKSEKEYIKEKFNSDKNINELQDEFEKLDLYSDIVKKVFIEDLEGEKYSKNFLLVLPAGNSGHIEAGIAYGLNKKCYAIGNYDITDSLYLIFDKIFKDEKELTEFLKDYKNK